MRIEFDALIKHRDDRIKIYRRHVLDHQEKKIMVWNYNEANLPKGRRPIPKNLIPAWSPGVMESGPTDYVELGNRFEKEVDANVSSIDDWCAAVWSIPPEQAMEKVNANAERNAELRKIGIIEPPMPDEPELDGEDVEPKPDDNTEPVEPADPNATGGVEDVEPDKIVANVYQIVKAIEVNAATAVDLRMALYPDESRAQAEVMVAHNTEFNLEMAEIIGKTNAAEAEAARSGEPPKIEVTTKREPEGEE
jgi:hypothetical protein